MMKLMRIYLLAAALVSALTVTALGVEGENGYDLIQYQDGQNYLTMSLYVPGDVAPEGYTVDIYCSRAPQRYEKLLFTEEASENTFTSLSPGTYDMARVLLGSDSWYEDGAEVLDVVELTYPIVVETGAFTIPNTAALEHMREPYAQEGYAWYKLTGVEHQYSYLADDDDLWTYHLLGRGDCTPYFYGLENGSPVDIYALDILNEGDRYIQRVSEPLTLDLPTPSREKGYGIRLIADPTTLWAVFAVPEHMDSEGLYTLCFYNSEYGMEEGCACFDGYTPGDWIDLYSLYGLADRVAVYEYDESGDHLSQSCLADLKLDKPVLGTYDAADFPYEGVQATAFENLYAANSHEAYAYAFSDLFFDHFSYILLNPHEGISMVLTEPMFYDDDTWLGEDMELRVMLASAQDAYYALAVSKPLLLDILPEELTDRLPFLSLTVNGGGTVTLANHRLMAGDELVGGNEDVSFEAPADGPLYLSFDREDLGYYDMVITRPGCLTFTVKDVAVEGFGIDFGVIDLVPGDVNGDNKINISDMGAFRQDFGKVGETIANSLTDVNNDGKVNIADMGIFRQNFGKTAEKDCTYTFQS